MNQQEKQTAEHVQTFFHNIAGEFDAIYSGETSAFRRFLNKWLRKDIYQRYEMTIAECGDVHGKRVVDIGCGSGRYCHELSNRGAAQCIGIDFAQNMLDLAEQFATQRNVADKCKFVLGDYLDIKVEPACDIAIAMGYFDYIADPVPHLKKMRTDAREKVIAIFPVAGTLRAAIRKVRLTIRGCPVFYFTESQVRGFFEQSGWKTKSLTRIGQLWFVVAVPA